MKKTLATFLAAALLAGSASAADKLVIKGSDTLGAKLVPLVAEAFKAQNPEVAISVLLENAGGGGANSAPLAGMMFKRYFANQKMPAVQQAAPDSQTIALR